MMRFLCILLIALSIKIFSQSYNVKGIVVDDQNKALSYASVSEEGTTNGTSTNSEGEFLIKSSNKSFLIRVTYLGYQTNVYEVVDAKRDLYIKIKLTPVTYSLRDVRVTPGNEDPAYPIVRDAIAKRDYYYKLIRKYNCRAYSKAHLTITDLPSENARIMFKKIFKNPDDRKRLMGMIYLSESESELYYEFPTKFQEKMISSKVSGRNDIYSINYISFIMLNFYKNRIELPVDATQRGFVCPIADNAMFYYSYVLESTFESEGNTIYKIAVLPKRNINPLFSGYIFIEGESWRLFAVDLNVINNKTLEPIDTAKVKQTFLKVRDSLYVPLMQEFQMSFKYKFLNLKAAGNGLMHTNFTQYIVQETTKPQKKQEKKKKVEKETDQKEEPKPIFKGNRIIEVDVNANKRDSVYWIQNRQIPLTNIELRNYTEKDSLKKITESKPYQDSFLLKHNKFNIMDLLTSYHYSNKFNKTYINIYFPFINARFNTVQGYNSYLDFDYYKEDKNRKYFYFKINQKFGFSDKKYYFNALFKYRYNSDYERFVELLFGNDILQINNHEPVGSLYNSFYSLLATKNYMKLYNKRYIELSHSSEFLNGLFNKTSVSYSLSNALLNNTNHKWINSENEYTSNNPYNPDFDVKAFDDWRAFKINTFFKIDFFQETVYMPYRFTNPSSFPKFTIEYTMALKNVFGSDADYKRLELGINWDLPSSFYGISSISIYYGNHFDTKNMKIVDLKHFLGNQMLVQKNNHLTFNTLDYYKYSSSKEYFVINYQHNFNGFLFSVLPLVKKTGVSSYVKYNLLKTTNYKPLNEYTFGISNIYKMFSVGFTGVYKGSEFESFKACLIMPF